MRAPKSCRWLAPRIEPKRSDPFALVELARDVRPDDYATTYVRQALQFSGLEAPVAAGEPTYLADDVHWNAHGHAVAARLVADFVRSEGLLPR